MPTKVCLVKAMVFPVVVYAERSCLGRAPRRSVCCSEQESLPHLVGAINISLSMAGSIYIKNMLSVGVYV